MRQVEIAAKSENARLLVLETSSLPTYEATRRFYVKNSYEQAAIVKDYYADGHDMVIFSKRLNDWKTKDHELRDFVFLPVLVLFLNIRTILQWEF